MAHLQGDSKARYVAQMFARISRRYDLLNTLMSGGLHHRWRRLATRLATDGLAGTALDVATGTGDFLFELIKRPDIDTAVGLDVVPEMLDLARRKAQRRSMSHPLVLIQGDALALPFQDDVFACVTTGFAMRNVADLPRALAEMTRVIRPGGRVAILEIVPMETKGPLSRLMQLYFRWMVPVLGSIVAGDREAYTYLPKSVEVFPTAGKLAGLMEQAGLESVNWRKAGMGSVAILVGQKP